MPNIFAALICAIAVTSFLTLISFPWFGALSAGFLMFLLSMHLSKNTPITRTEYDGL